MITTKVSDKYRVTLPSAARRKLHISIGDHMEVIVKEGVVMLKPKKMIDSSQAYFWVKEWQEKEKQVDTDFTTGKFQTADSLEEFFRKLHHRKS